VRPGPGPDWAPLSMRTWVAQDLHRTLITAIDYLLGHHPGTGALLDDLRYHAGLLGCRLAASRVEPTSIPGTTTNKDLM
jgi:hypothetical protein